MNKLMPWQRVVYFFGETVMVGGLLWGLWIFFTSKGCPVSWFNHITLIVLGLLISVIPLHPFGQREYFSPWLRNVPVAAILWWLLALIGTGLSVYQLVTNIGPMTYMIFVPLVPAALFFWFAIPSKLSDKPLPPQRAPAADNIETPSAEALVDEQTKPNTDEE